MGMPIPMPMPPPSSGTIAQALRVNAVRIVRIKSLIPGSFSKSIRPPVSYSGLAH
jgi:hypothetical protein